MVKKNQKWNWIKKQEKTFKKLKKKFTKEVVLAVPNLDKKIRIEVDISDYATERVLSTKYEDGK